jgi:hypothetical protein
VAQLWIVRPPCAQYRKIAQELVSVFAVIAFQEPKTTLGYLDWFFVDDDSLHFMKQLMTKLEVYGQNAFPDAFYMTAYHIECSLIQAGAEPGKDYMLLDLYKLAQPFVLNRYQKNELTDCR